MIRLKKVTISGFKSKERIVIVDFSDENTSIIYGENGCGKTTFLKILNAIFTQNETILISEEVTKVEIDFYEEIEGKKILKSITISRSEDLFGEPIEATGTQLSFESYNSQAILISHSYDWSQYKNSSLDRSKSLFLGVDRGSQSQRSTVNTKLLINFLSKNNRYREMFKSPKNLHDFSVELAYFLKKRANLSSSSKTIDFEADHLFLKEISMENVEGTLLSRYRQARRNAARQVQNALFDTLSLAISEREFKEDNHSEFNSISKLIFKNRELIIEALDDNLENSFKDTIIQRLKNIKSEDDISNLKDNPLLMKLLVKMSQQLKESEAELSAVNTVIDKFNQFTSDDKKLDFTKNEIMVKVKGGEHSVSELSSGERHILTLFTLLLDQGRGRDFIIIDEPEISLNSKWQDALLPTLIKLLPNSQIIVASHSPIIVQSIDTLAELEVLV